MKTTLLVGWIVLSMALAAITVSAASIELWPSNDLVEDWSNVSCPSNAEWACVHAESGIDDTRYIRMGNDDKKETFYLGDFPLNFSGIIDSVSVRYRAKWYDSSDYKITDLIETHGTQYEGFVTALNGSFVNESTLWLKNPFTNANWTIGEINSLHFGVSTDDGSNVTLNGGGMVSSLSVKIFYH